jgi:hypothetical protein
MQPVMGETALWLKLHDFPEAKVCRRDYPKIQPISEESVLIDDYPVEVEQAIAVGRRGILFARPWNSNATHLPVMQAWSEAEELLAMPEWAGSPY